MSDSLAPRRRRPGSNPPDSGGAGGVSPGKTTRTQGLPATGFPLIDEKPLCEQENIPEEERAGCHLSESDRTRLLIVFQTGLITATDNFRDGIQDERIDQLTQTAAGWGFLEDWLFYSISGPLVAAATRAAMHVALRSAARLAETNLDSLTLSIAKVDEKTIREFVVNVSRGARAHIKHGRMGIPEGNKGKAVFLQRLREGIKPFIDHMIASAPTQLNDDALVALAHGYHDATEHSVAAYAGYIKEKLASFDENKMDDVGRKRIDGEGPAFDVMENQRGRLVWVNDKRRRLALFAGRSGQSFIRWIDLDWEQLAVSLYQERAKKEPDEMTIDAFRSSVRIGEPREEEEATWLDAFLGDR